MNKTKIEWCNFTWNTVVGCQNGCSYCYARKIRNRFYPDIPFETIVNYDERLEEPLKLKKPSRIFVGSMTDLFADWMPEYNVRYILEIVEKCPQHRFLFLTKNPKGYEKYDFPDNCWLGQTVIKKEDYIDLRKIKNKTFISFEPLLNDLGKYYMPSDWYIIGGLTPKIQHQQEWIKEILSQGNKFRVPCFIKSNAKYSKIINNYPKELML